MEAFTQPAPSEVGKSKYRYIFLDSLEECINGVCKGLDGSLRGAIRSALDNWFGNNGTSYAQVEKEGKGERNRFLYGFDIGKLERDLLRQSVFSKEQIGSFITALSGACAAKKPKGAVIKPNDEDMPFMQKKDDGFRNA